MLNSDQCLGENSKEAACLLSVNIYIHCHSFTGQCSESGISWAIPKVNLGIREVSDGGVKV